MSEATHEQLVALAGDWLRRNGHSVVVTEIATAGEEPDAIGWQGTRSTLVECKATRADFFSDGNKSFRRDPATGIGIRRYYMVPAGLIKREELPNVWGLLEVSDGKVRKVYESGHFECSHLQEVRILLSLLRRIGQTAPKGVSIKCYTISTANRATLTMDSEFQKGTNAQ